MKKILVLVGAGRGLGNAVAKKFAENDFQVVLIARNEKNLKNYVEEFKREGFTANYKVADAMNPETLTTAFKEIFTEIGTPDALVYNVGNTQLDGENEITSEILMQHYQMDVASAWHCAMLVATEEFSKKNGAIIFTGGGFAKTFKPILQLKPLCIDKAALNAVNIVLHEYFAPKNIFVGSVLVSGVISPEDEKYNPDKISDEYWKMYTERKNFEVLY
jgi:short-subunit dehydrogenase